ncbi:MAG: hypothetical protein NDI61_10970 [Bdellovibrionaceae bacterium]|nr:hypothetical protein [Pseudobdellovibrionaceae bacterium]
MFRTSRIATWSILTFVALALPAGSSLAANSGAWRVKKKAPTVTYPRAAYLDLEDDQIVSVFNKSGENYKSCAETKGCRAIGWPGNDAKIFVTGPSVHTLTPNIYTGKKEEEEFFPVKFYYERVGADGVLHKQEGEGWIDAASVRFQKVAPMFRAGATKPEPFCPDKPVDGAPDITKLKKLIPGIKNLGARETAAEIHSHIGMCAWDSDKQIAPIGKGQNSYDTLILRRLRNAKVPNILREDQSPMTQQDLIDIDALARTMYGEMARCFKHGLHYPMAVAKIAKARAENKTRHKEFVQGPHSSGKTDLQKVVTSASQFNVWMPRHKNGPNGAFRQALCPPRSKKERYWRGSSPPDEEIDVWQKAVLVATEAVLFPSSFAARTSNVKDYFYTSGMGRFYRMRQVFPAVEGRKISINKCMEIWSDRR